MLNELAVTNLGVIAELRLVLDDGMTAVTGETGAGKTLIVEAIDLLAGGRADASIVRHGASEAIVEGRFSVLSDNGDDEIVVRRVVPATGRSRAYIDGQMATAKALGEVVAEHVDLYAQHAQHSLLTASGQRAALDRYAGTALAELQKARDAQRAIAAELESLGGDLASREREMELLRFQLNDLDRADVSDPEEDDRLADQERALSDVADTRARSAEALAALTDESGALELLGAAVSGLAATDALREQHRRLAGLMAELEDAATELRRAAEAIVEDPEKLEAILNRRQLLAGLRRRHGDGSLAGVIAEHQRLAGRLAGLEDAEGRSGELMTQLDAATSEVAQAAAAVAATRRAAAPRLAGAVEAELRKLAMPAARFDVLIGDEDPGDDVEMRFTANPGTSLAPLARSASGGELARAMLALRLVAATEQETVIFDEVDAGIGGEAATAVGNALARVGQTRQVLVVTHLAQVAAAADQQVGVTKVVEGGQTTTVADVLGEESRVVELSRMLSGQPTSDSAHAHARELLASAGGGGGRG